MVYILEFWNTYTKNWDIVKVYSEAPEFEEIQKLYDDKWGIEDLRFEIRKNVDYRCYPYEVEGE